MHEITNVSDVLAALEAGKSGWIFHFRGQTCDWPLRPSLARDNVSDNERKRESDCFRKLAEILPQVNDWELAAVAQHYGIPTRLLDWSENPLVGLYFAVADDHYDKGDGVIWVFQDKTAVAGNVAALHDGMELRRLRHPRPYRAWRDLRHKIPRTLAQRGSLTSQPDLSRTFDQQLLDDATQHLRKYLVPKQAKSRLRRQLEILGVTKLRLFPDLLDIGRPTDLVGECVRIRYELFATK